jgi:phosphoglycerate dehydrogenase-like enzyme
MKILNTSFLDAAFWKGGLDPRVSGAAYSIVDAHLAPEDRLILEVADAEILIGDYTHNTHITAKVAEAAQRLKLIQQPSAGYNNIDVSACKRKGIPVANTHGANDIGVAEHTIMLALACLKKLTYFNAKTHAGEWKFQEALQKGVFEINQKTYGLIGMGRTAREVAKRLVPFGVKVFYYDVVKLNAEEESQYQATFAPLDEILKTADVVSLHLPLNDETRGIISAEKLALMKPSSILINVGRGELANEVALAAAVKEGKLAAAAVDVFSKEPPPADHPLFGLENVILTPHLAGSTRESGARIMTMALDNIARVIRGEKPQWLVY